MATNNQPGAARSSHRAGEIVLGGTDLNTTADLGFAITFSIPGIPTAWARAGGNGRTRFTPAKQRQAMAVVQTIAADAMHGRPPLAGPLSMSINAVWPWPKSMSDRKRKLPGAHWRASRPDADNIAKLVADALNGICWLDDAQVVSLQVSKEYGSSAITIVAVTAVVPEVSP